MFQFTRPQGARHHGMHETRCGRWFQFTRPQGARHNFMLGIISCEVSIHAPARGATGGVVEFLAIKCFNSRARKGRDGEYGWWHPEVGVSIHAPARGATENFTDRINQQLFQFTRPQGARRALQVSCMFACGVNSRAREGRDPTKGDDMSGV